MVLIPSEVLACRIDRQESHFPRLSRSSLDSVWTAALWMGLSLRSARRSHNWRNERTTVADESRMLLPFFIQGRHLNSGSANGVNNQLECELPTGWTLCENALGRPIFGFDPNTTSWRRKPLVSSARVFLDGHEHTRATPPLFWDSPDSHGDNGVYEFPFFVDWLLKAVASLVKEMLILPMEETGRRPGENKPYQFEALQLTSPVPFNCRSPSGSSVHRCAFRLIRVRPPLKGPRLRKKRPGDRELDWPGHLFLDGVCIWDSSETVGVKIGGTSTINHGRWSTRGLAVSGYRQRFYSLASLEQKARAKNTASYWRKSGGHVTGVDITPSVSPQELHSGPEVGDVDDNGGQ
ncbi:hypothetical protein QBC45DRAFT_461025 [Copromyces sp. CBS 386.78]|nr:hypothetical protein QBC45DRAFT_461025 [Copromyces sp. CBS 386.78]